MRPVAADPRRTPRALAMLLAVLALLAGCTSSGGGNEPASPEDRLRAHLDLAEGYMEVGDLSRAKLPLERALAIDSRSWEAHDLLGRIYQREGEADLAERHFRNAARYDRDNARVRNDYGVFLYEQGRYDEAVEQLERAVADPDSAQRPVAYENLGLASLASGERTRARNAFARAVMLDEDRSVALLELAELAFADADFAQSASYFERYRNVARPTARSLWLGIRLARRVEDRDAEASYALQLRNLFPQSEQFRRWRESSADG
jgi:type IV pilus assembly protein PilF